MSLDKDGNAAARDRVVQWLYEQDSASAPRLAGWIALHLFLAVLMTVTLVVFPKDGMAWIVVSGPLGLGLVQAVALRRRLPIWAVVLWPIATVLGFPLSMSFGLFLYVAFGFCFSLCQVPLLAVGRFRGWFLWPVIGGAAWIVAGLAGALVIQPEVARTISRQGQNSLAVSLVLFVYALSTGLALRRMTVRPPTCPADGLPPV